jgi:cytochrome c oxidase subunit 4
MGHGSGHHIVPLKTYINVLGALLVLTVITVLAAQFDFGFLNTIVALGIASVKAYLVLSIFMGLKYEQGLSLNAIIFGTGVFFLVLLFAFAVLDIYTRVSEFSTL